jgi:hypothetical protein
VERLLITDLGRIGIGNSSPQYTLDVSGSANFTQGIYLNGLPIGTGGATTNIVGLISTGDSDLRYYGINNPNFFIKSGEVVSVYYPISNPANYIKSGEVINLYVLKTDTGNFISASQTGQFYPTSNPYFYIRSGDIIGTYATINYVNFISGELASQIQAGGGGSGVIFLNSLAGTINLISSTDSFIFNNTGNNINIWSKEQNSEIYRNISGQITGVKYNADFSRIFRDSTDKITGIFYNNYFKRILYDINNSVTGVNVYYY